MTASVMFNIAQGEKQLLSIVNATVSHEMRNPINSISNQILQLKMLN
jgi:signal transduction histidine kinase